MVTFMHLPDVVLLLILEKLPMWKILQLGRLCHRLNHLKQVCFNTRITHLRLFAGSVLRKLNFNDDRVDFYRLRGDFDLIIRLANQHTPKICPFRPHCDIFLSEDWSVESADQLLALGRLLPRVTHLTLVVLSGQRLSNCFANILANWPQLKSLKLLLQGLGYGMRSTFTGGPLKGTLATINSLDSLEHLQIDIQVRLADPVATFAPLITRGKLKTLICVQNETDTERNDLQNWSRVWSDRTIWNGPSAAILERGLDTFGLFYYTIDSQDHLTNQRLLSKLKRLHGSLVSDGKSIFPNLLKWNLTHWTALQCLHLEFHSKTLSSLSRVLTHLSVLSNLTELHLNVNTIYTNTIYTNDDSYNLSEENCQNLPRIASIRKFRIKCFFEPHNQCLHLLAGAFPNAAELSFQLWTGLYNRNTSETIDHYFERRGKYLPKLCVKCRECMKRAFDRYGNNIASFHWFLELGQQEQNQPKLIPKVKLYTVEIAGRTRLNYDCIPY